MLNLCQVDNPVWSNYRNHVCELQHLALHGPGNGLVSKVGKMMDDSRWIIDPKSEEPIGKELFYRLQHHERVIARLKAESRRLERKANRRKSRIKSQTRTIQIFKNEIVALWTEAGLLRK